MSTSGSSIPTAIRDRISAPAQPRVWTPDDFADLGPRTAVDQALHRLVASRDLRRIARGFYDTPQNNRLTGKPTHPNPRDVIDALTRKGKVRVVIDGLTAANDLGSPTRFQRGSACSPMAECAPLHSATSPSTFKPPRPAASTGRAVPPRGLCRRFIGCATSAGRRRKPPQAPYLHTQRPRSWTGHSRRFAQRPIGPAGMDAGNCARPTPAG